MKKSLFYLFALICSMSLFTSCSDDDESPAIPVADVNATFSSTDATNKLVMTYSGKPMVGKEVIFNTLDGKKATLVLKGSSLNIGGLIPTRDAGNMTPMTSGVVPGEVTTTLNVELSSADAISYTFQGVDTKDGRTINYTGTVKKGQLSIDLTVKMPANNLMGTWNLAPVVPGELGEANKSQPIYTAWKSTTSFNLDLFGMGIPVPMPAGDLLSLATSVMPLYAGKTGNELLLSVFEKVTFKEDGNIVASYSDGKNVAKPEWNDSPVNIAQYYVKDNKVYVLLNINMILGSFAKPTSAGSRMDITPIIPGLIKDVLPMLVNGIPLSYTQDTEKMKVYADTQMVMMLMNVVAPLLNDEATIKDLLASLASNPSFAPFAGVVKGMLEQLPGVLNTTSNFELGINLIKDNLDKSK